MMNSNDRLSYSHSICAHHYSDEFFDADIPMYLDHARRSGSPILELGCGTGRLLIPLAQAGLRVVGLDLYAPMLRMASEKIAKLDEDTRKRITLLQADMSRFSLRRGFNMAYVSANTIFHLSRQEQRECLECAHDALKYGGTILIDCESSSSIATAQECVGMLNRCDDYEEDASRGPRVRGGCEEVGSRVAECDDAGRMSALPEEVGAGKITSVRSWITDVDLVERVMCTRVEITERSRDGDNSRLAESSLWKRLERRRENGGGRLRCEEVGKVQEHSSTYNHILHWLDRDELERLLNECGFRTTRIYGGWDMRSFSEEDHRMIFVAERVYRDSKKDFRV